MQVVSFPMEQDKAIKTSGQSLVYNSDQFFQGRKEIIIQHENASYRLRITRQGKLILTK